MAVLAIFFAMWLGFSDVEHIELKGPTGEAIVFQSSAGSLAAPCRAAFASCTSGCAHWAWAWWGARGS